ncbi:MAG: D-glycero-beta-D-manno-heptose 1-phosphate adenylyltransferase [Candidatus Kapabacteria bacterium]|nr:D-glycero-beta-D-manno-heptose 1-phosphate adenylyltransferase [Candidatus Kapabacteria bacterium]
MAKSNNKKIVFTNGVFDILHVGHVSYLEKAKQLGDILVLGLNSDASVKKLKGDSRPINNEIDRANVLLGLKSVDYVCIFDEETPLNLIKSVNPSVLVKGADYSIENIVGADFVQKNGGEVKTITFIEGKSTTSTIAKMRLIKND